MIQDILMAIPLGVLLCFMIGPVFFILLETAVTKGFKAALIFDLGVVTADFIFIAIAYFSSYRLLISIKDEPALYLFGGLIMITYGVISYLKLNKVGKIKEESTLEVELFKKDYWSLYFKGIFLNIINIGVFGFWLLVFITFGPLLELKISRLTVFFITVIITYLLVDTGKIILAKKLKSKLTPINILKIKKITSILLIVFGLSIMMQGLFPSENKLVKKVLEKVEPER
jgi:threonine/homoserine/homoserine lactone efflux protein